MLPGVYLNNERSGLDLFGVSDVPPDPLAHQAAGHIEKEIEFVHVCKLQITSTKIQINHKSQYPMTETHVPRASGYCDLGSTIRQR